jgi:signal transduction histidine kinase
MKEYPLELGLLPIFRAYIFLRFGALLLIGVVFLGGLGRTLDQRTVLTAVLYLVEAAFLFIYLYWSWARRKLGRWYLPIALLVAAVAPIIQVRYVLYEYGGPESVDFWLVFPFLTVPLILTAWQYHFQEVLAFCVGTTLLELAALQFVAVTRAMSVLVDGGTVVARMLFLIAIGYIVSSLMTAQRRQRRELAEATHKLVHYAATLEQLAVTRERNRLARELHDTLAHTLSGLTVQLDALATVWQPQSSKAARMLNHALTTTREGLGGTRRALQALRAAPLDDLGLALAIRNLAKNAAARGALFLELDVLEQLDGLSAEVEQCYYRVAQEALENVVRHANARRVTVSLKRTEGRLILEVSDDGSGFAPESIVSEDRFGLRGMQERAELIGGTLEVENRSGQGTTIRLHAGEKR